MFTDASQYKRLNWDKHADEKMKGFPGVFTLWSLTTTKVLITKATDS